MIDISVFFAIPESIITTGLIMCLILLFVSSQEMGKMRGNIQIGKIDKQTIMRLSKERRIDVVKVMAVATVICSLSTATIAWLFISFSSKTLLAFLGCLIVQVIDFIGLCIPFYRKLLLIVQA